MSFHQPLRGRTGPHWLDDLSDLSCKDSTRQHTVTIRWTPAEHSSAGDGWLSQKRPILRRRLPLARQSQGLNGMNGVRWRPLDVGQAAFGNARVSSGHWSATRVGVTTSIVSLPPRGLSRWFWTLALKRSNYWTAGKLSDHACIVDHHRALAYE